MKKISPLLSIAVVLLTNVSLHAQNAVAGTGSWKIKGNKGTDPLINFIGTKDDAPLVFRTASVERMRITRNGNVGIGTSTVKAKLQVDSGQSVSLLSPGYLQLGSSAGYNLAFDYHAVQARNDSTASDLYLNSFGGVTFLGPSASAFRVGADGTVGIRGNNLPSYALSVNASPAMNGINITNPGDNYILNGTKSGMGYGIYVEKTSTSSSNACIEANSTGSAAGIEGLSKSSFGVSGYSTKYYGVNGFAGVTGGNSSIGVYGYGNYGVYAKTANKNKYYAGYFVGDIFTTGDVFTGSDERLKQNIENLSSAINIISQLHPKQYKFKQDGNYALMNLPETQHYGLIAQDVEKVLPGLVKNSMFDTKTAIPKIPAKDGEPANEKAESETMDFKAVNYIELIPVMIKGIQEQQTIIENQEQRIAQLEQLVQKLSGTSISANIKSSAYLKQNAPNPFSQTTVISCFIPDEARSSKLILFDAGGRQLKEYSLNNKGVNNITINARTLAAGEYNYTLLVDGKIADSKSMTLTK